MLDSANPYLKEIEQALPRVLASFDCDPFSPTRGLGDRRFWAWKTADFPNATMQGAVNGLSRIVAAGMLPASISEASIIGRIDDAIEATKLITARDGSLVEAFPNEKSFCVTALVAFDILCAADGLAQKVPPEMVSRWRETAAPLIDFICRNDETHAIISNHLATAVAALLRWKGRDARIARERAQQLLSVIMANQSAEGWYSEYGAMDPGYETLGLYYLADAYGSLESTDLRDSIGRSLGFVAYFCHPDGSFGGVYGSRNTRFLVPAAFEALALTIPEAADVARFARQSIADRSVVTLAAIDEPNLAPHFNAYCHAAAESMGRPAPEPTNDLPHESSEPFRRTFEHAQCVIDNGPSHYTVVSISKGGVVAHFKKDEASSFFDPGVCGRMAGRTYSTQALQSDNEHSLVDNVVTVSAPFVELIGERPTPLKFLVLRVLALTVFLYRPFAEWTKRALVKRLITGQRLAGVTNTRTIRLGPEIEIADTQTLAGEMELLRSKKPFTAIHMASAGYWQVGDDKP
ncbi:MAG: hypothetical protein JJ920_19815 [Roseitalea sp.]|jgi:hypothetical protein|nr:hypothetical protein [Roseitalea sp.]MBO6722761.1 hypothetical protein [Roseitalea sp.]MBO6745165.1 hypothetical protein [Roseitalea sp.]